MDKLDWEIDIMRLKITNRKERIFYKKKKDTREDKFVHFGVVLHHFF